MNGQILTILLIEDNDDHAELVMRSFQDNMVANKIIRLADGEEALNYIFCKGKYTIQKNDYIPNLILLDLRLPKIDGIEVLKQIKTSEKLRQIPVVILTSSQSEMDIAKSYTNYANSYLVKPLDFEKFTHLMRDLGLYWLCYNQKPF
jgi:CheY-like chemotaxis protein